MYSPLRTSQFSSRCIVCKQVLYHRHNLNSTGYLFTRIAHYHCSVLMIALNRVVKGELTIQKFAQRCIKYDISPTDKALYMELAIKNL